IAMIKSILHQSLLRSPTACKKTGIRHISRARAKFVDPTAINGPTERPTDISIGSPGSSYVIIEPDIGSKLVGQHFEEGEKAEVPLMFFHQTKHFAKGLKNSPSKSIMDNPSVADWQCFVTPTGSDVACPKLYINQDLASNNPNETASPAILFRYGVASTITIKGTKDGKLLRRLSSGLVANSIPRIRGKGDV
ncbi:MAG: hypothetical protein Q9224_007008, partial [Gallowayella concinna]